MKSSGLQRKQACGVTSFGVESASLLGVKRALESNKSLQQTPKAFSYKAGLGRNTRMCGLSTAGLLNSMLGFQDLLKEPIDVTD
jgi:hypothetical protein